MITWPKKDLQKSFHFVGVIKQQKLCTFAILNKCYTETSVVVTYYLIGISI